MITVNIDKCKKVEVDDYSAFISFDFNMNILNEIRKLPFKFYFVDEKVWEVPVSKLDDLVDKLKNFDIKITGNLGVLDNQKTETTLPENFKFKTEPYEHQLKGVEFGLKYDKWFLGDEMGLGKTKQTIDIAVARKVSLGYKHCLIVCGVNTLKWNWVNEVLTHSNEKPWILGQKEGRNGKVTIGSTKDKVADLDYLLKNESSTYFLITNIESFRNDDFSKKIQELCKREIINMCVVDEVHKCKNPTAQQTKGFLKCLPKCRIAMTGTPIMNSPLDLYIILKWLGYESHAFYSFKQHYCVMGGYGGYEVVGYKNMSELTEKINSIMLRRLKDEVLDLPEKTYIDEYVEMTDKQNIIYKEVKMDIKSNIDQIKVDLNPLAQLIRLRQATGYTGILSSEIQESAKMDRLIDLVEECKSNNKKVIVFSNWTQMTDEIFKQLYNKYKVMQITGETPDNLRQQIVNAFQKTDTCNVLVGTIGAMGTGLTLTAADTVIFVDEPWNKALFEQAVDRCHRIGQKNNITIYSLMCKDTIDERIHKLIYKKGAMSDAIIDGKVNMSNSDLFNYLLD